jgi:hypothetical protein
MACWIYKCNSKNREHQVVSGDWAWLFDRGRTSTLGTTRKVPALAQLKPGDTVIAHQTDRNELVGVCRVVRPDPGGRHEAVWLEPLLRVGVRVRPPKKAFPRVAAISALKPGPIRTLYPISDVDARRLLRAAGAETDFEETSAEREETFLEGDRRAAVTTVRNPGLRAAAKRRWGTACFCCGFEFGLFYGPAGAGLALVHHLRPFVGGRGKRRATTVEEVRVVCPNCHYMIHATDPLLDAGDLRRRITKRWTRWSAGGMVRRAGGAP